MHDFHNSFTIIVFITNVSSESEIQLKKIERVLFHFHYPNQEKYKIQAVKISCSCKNSAICITSFVMI